MKSILSFAALAFFLCFNASAQDGYLENLGINTYIKTGTNYSLPVHVRNATNTGITSCTVKWQLDNGSINTNNYNVGGAGIQQNSYLPVTLSNPVSVSGTGNYTLKVWVEVSGDIDNSNDTITKELIALANYVNNTVLIEKHTGTWCQYCPSAGTAFGNIKQHSNVALASFHRNDSYSFSAGQTYMGNFYSGGIFTPAGIINQGEMGDYSINNGTTTWEDQVLTRIGISPVELVLSTSLNPSTRELTVDLKANFKHAFDGAFYFNAYVIENGIVGTQSGASGSYTHDHVVRDMLGGVNGTGGIIPSSPVANTDYDHSYTTTIPSGWDISNIEVVAVVFEKIASDMNTLNAASATPQAVGRTTPIGKDAIILYPNPTNDFFVLQSDQLGPDNYQVNVVDMFGRVVMTENIQGIGNQIYDITGLEPGMYIVEIANLSTNEKHQIKMIKE